MEGNKRHQLSLVSVCVPTYNGEGYLEEALNSIILQSYKNIEVIISDDASTDTTLKICQKFKENQPFQVKILNHEPSGIAENWNNSMRHASGKYIKFLFQDDILKPDCITKMVNAMENYPNMTLVCCKRELVYTNMNRFVDGFLKNFTDLQVNLNLPYQPLAIIDGKDILKNANFKLKPINIIGEPVTVLFRRSLIKKIGYFHKSMFQLVDYEYFMRFFKYGKIGFFNEALVKFRLHDSQASFINKKQELNDHDTFYRLLYKDYFWYLHNNFRWILLKRYHPLFKTLVSIKRSMVS